MLALSVPFAPILLTAPLAAEAQESIARTTVRDRGRIVELAARLFSSRPIQVNGP